MNKIQEQIISHVQMDIEPGEVVTEELLTELVRFYSCRHPLSESEFKEVVVDLQSKLAVRMDRGAYVKEKNHISWYYAAKSSINPQFWTREFNRISKKSNKPRKSSIFGVFFIF